ncbi:MAG: DNA polymerase III subunit gamma/tau [Lachnospiraceae bacterium]|nr:DNA polymerase III subunit gamma/tau [Lachnospiraceae bacterium]
MAYTALYRKFRPDNYEDVKGQEHITRTLANQVINNRIGHAYLFCGTRGTGKTTVAKIFARAVNCEHPVNGNPCNECETCKAIMAGNSMNVIEMDAASNNGVDSIREIVEEVQYRPPTGKYKVYIIDEVHMLSISAFNALLKTLEEPPEYVIFILATTEPHKIPVTILSRCQRYDFKHIALDTIQARLKELADKENMDIEDKAIRYIAKCGDGSMRDALSLLDECQAFAVGEALTYDKTLEILGAVDTEIFSKMLRSILKKDTLEVMGNVEEMVNYGRDLAQFVVDFTWYLRNLLLMKTSKDASEIIDMSSERMEALKEEAQMIEIPVVMRYIRILSELTNQIRYATQKRVLIEIALIKLMQPEMEKDLESLTNRVANVEKKLENGILVDSAQMGNAGQNIGDNYAKKFETEQQKKEEKKQLEKAVPEEVKKIVANWQIVMSDLSGMCKSYVLQCRKYVDAQGKLGLYFASSTGLKAAEEHRESIKEAIEKYIGKEVEIDMASPKESPTYGDGRLEIVKEDFKDLIDTSLMSIEEDDSSDELDEF